MIHELIVIGMAGVSTLGWLAFLTWERAKRA